MTDLFDYHLFGLHIRSAIELPGIEREDGNGPPDVTVDITAVSADDPGVIFDFEGAGKYRIDGGRTISIEPQAGAPPENVRLYLLGSAMGVLLHQRGLLPLHANAIQIDGRAFAFMGASGAGKSTLAAMFYDRGFTVIADDVSVVGFEGDEAFVAAGIPRLRLWEDALAATGRSSDSLVLSYAGDDHFRKFDVPLETGKGDRKTPLAAIYLLDRGKDVAFSPITGAEAVNLIFANTYRGGFVRSEGDPQQHWKTATRLANSVPIFRFARPWALEDARGRLDQVIGHAREI